jgi:hypothetical protein
MNKSKRQFYWIGWKSKIYKLELTTCTSIMQACMPLTQIHDNINHFKRYYPIRINSRMKTDRSPDSQRLTQRRKDYKKKLSHIAKECVSSTKSRVQPSNRQIQSGFLHHYVKISLLIRLPESRAGWTRSLKISLQRQIFLCQPSLVQLYSIYMTQDWPCEGNRLLINSSLL